VGASVGVLVARLERLVAGALAAGVVVGGVAGDSSGALGADAVGADAVGVVVGRTTRRERRGAASAEGRSIPSEPLRASGAAVGGCAGLLAGGRVICAGVDAADASVDDSGDPGAAAVRVTRRRAGFLAGAAS